MAVTINGYVCDLPPDSNGRCLRFVDANGNGVNADPIFTSDPTFTGCELAGNGTYEVFMGRYDASGAYWAAVWAPRPFFVVGTMGIMDIAVKVTDPNADDKAIDAKQSEAEE